MDTWLAAFDWERAGVITILVLVVALFATGRILSRRSADREHQALIDGQVQKDAAHAELMAYKDQRIQGLLESVKRRDDLLERREQQLGVVLDELAPVVLAWGEATREATKAVTGGQDGKVKD